MAEYVERLKQRLEASTRAGFRDRLLDTHVGRGPVGRVPLGGVGRGRA